MASGVFQFNPGFKEFLPVYKNVTRVWIGDGVETGLAGMLYAEYVDGTVRELGSVSVYALARKKGYEGTEEEWAQALVNLAQSSGGSTITVSYQNSPSGTVRPTGEWTVAPNPVKGQYLWTKTSLHWIDGSTTDMYIATYQGQDGPVQSVNGQTTVVTLHGENLPISSEDETSIKAYVDSKTFEAVYATDEQIDALFA